MKTGLVLEGGGVRGIYTAGVLDAFLEHRIEFDGVIGVSAGAIHGCSFVSKQKGRSIRYYKKYMSDPRFMSVRSLLKTGDYVGGEFCYHEIPEKLDLYDFDAFRQSKTKFYAAATNIETGKAEYFHFRDMKEEVEMMRASASLPLASRPVEFHGKKYLDGGCADSIPVEKFREMGYERNVVVLTREPGYQKQPQKTGVMKVHYRKYPEFIKALENRHIVYNNTLKIISQMEKRGEVLVIQPQRALEIGRLENDPDKTQEIYDQGYRDGLQAAERVKAFLDNGRDIQ